MTAVNGKSSTGLRGISDSNFWKRSSRASLHAGVEMCPIGRPDTRPITRANLQNLSADSTDAPQKFGKFFQADSKRCAKVARRATCGILGCDRGGCLKFI